MIPTVHFNPTALFITINEEEAQRIQRFPCCGVLAVAICSKKSFTEVFDLMREQKKAGSRWRGRTCHNDLRKALDTFKVKWVEDETPRTTLTRWVDQHAIKSRMYLVRTGNHFQVVHRGVVMDQRGAKPINEYWGRRKITTSAWEILNAV